MPEIQPTPSMDTIAGRIFELRGQRVMLDAGLAVPDGVPNKAFLQATKRDYAKFEDVVFQ